MSHPQRIFALLLTAVMLLCVPGAVADTVVVVRDTRAYAAPDASSFSVPVSAGTILTLVAQQDGVAAVRSGSITAFMPSGALEEVVEYAGETVYAAEDCAIRSGASNSSKALQRLASGKGVSLLATVADWAYVRSGSVMGFVPVSSLTTQPSEENIGAWETEAEEVRTITAYVVQDGAPVYASYSTGSKVLRTLAQNDTVQVSLVKNGWCQVRDGSTVAYMLQAHLSAQPKAITAYVKTDGARAYAKPSLGSYSVEVSCNTQLTVTACDTTWAQVRSGGVTAYMLLADLSETKVEPTKAALQYGDKGEEVKALQSRLKELGYFSGTIGGNYLQLTQAAVAAFQSAAKIDVTGIADSKTVAALLREDAPKYTPTATGGSPAVPATGTAKEMDWWDSGIQQIFARGTVAKITDVETGISWYEIRKGGTNHADVQPLTAADTKAMKKACGGWSWDRRAIFVTINGVNYAASMNCMPHGSGSIQDNDFDGHHCIHFTNSRTHGTNRVCSLHQGAIRKALAAKL